MTVDDGISNPSDNRPFEDVLRARLSRRSVMIGGLATAATAFFAQSGVATAARDGNPGPNPTPNRPGQGRPPAQPLIGFRPVGNPGGPTPVISEDYQWSTLIPWGAALLPGGEGFDPFVQANNTAEAQTKQIGIGHDGMWFFPFNGSNDHGILCINHEFGTNGHVLGASVPGSLEDVAKSIAAHGVSAVEVRRTGGRWESVVSSRNFRVTGASPVSFSGPVAGSEFLANPAGNPTLGTLNNCGNGYTPWGTYLTCEENFNGYFGATGAWDRTPERARYGFSAGGFGYGWHLFEERFDLSNPAYANEANRFGWIVEIDPTAPGGAPVKRTALGRFKHEGIATTTGRGGRLVGYMGDDESFDYIYKWVSADNWTSMRARGISPLDEGTLYVARFDDDGTGTWLPLTIDDPTLAARFSSQAELLTYVRIAADLLGATPMDRPEWTAVAPNGDVYITLTNNSARGTATVPNPQAPNTFGHIIRWRDADQHVGTAFEWDIYVLATDTQANPDSAFGSPDGLWVDPDGRVFIQTDGTQPTVAEVRGNDQLLVGSAFVEGQPPVIKRLFAGPALCEITGVAVTPDRRTMFINVQHPGNGNPAVTNFPAPQGSGAIPRDCTVVITRKDGGVIGS
jgi:secreted PhoX family phosphatase